MRQLQTYEDKYEQRELIGEGSYGRCYLCRHRLQDCLYVAKHIPMEEQPKRKQALLEAQIMSQLKNPFIVSYKQSFISSNGIIIIMEYCQNGDLRQLLDKYKKEGKVLKQSAVRSWLLQLTIGLNYLHTNKVIHRDLKPANILITKANTIKIADFGTSKLLLSVELTNTFIGTYCYMSPEVCKQQPYSYEGDIWSLGCILYEMSNQVQPFQSRGFAELMENIINCKVRPFSQFYSKQLQQIVGSMLVQKQKRVTLPKLISSPFFLSLLREEYTKNITSKMVNDSQLFIISEQIKEQIDDYVVDNELELDETIQSISNYIESKVSLGLQKKISQTEDKTHIVNSSVLAMSATFQEVEMRMPLRCLGDLNLPPKLKYK